MDFLACQECCYTSEASEFVPAKKDRYKLDLCEMLAALENYDMCCPRCGSDLIEAAE